ncbi:flagellar basal body rod C-terminal domain-containing protein [Parvularcula dongshanensis]|uniref:Flagellar basal-body rod protein FlgC n=1 Tax=Parvularcula dongshanensis TaxID=1173995 RepID=A0A840I5H4_9PROT|nr:flagellar basal body rod C-terminal domain-containing protein [Parvularcula dongshanensis]MBB4659642.1 flagellar basal-body rod protein FlgC [Parvularcula dongshanensis]
MVDPITAAMRAAADGMGAQSLRLRTVHENLSNVDTPGYHRKLLTFEAGQGDAAVSVAALSLDQKSLNRVLDPGHPLADPDGYVEMSNVDMLVEVTDAREAKRSFEANLEAFRQARETYSNLIRLLRR